MSNLTPEISSPVINLEEAIATKVRELPRDKQLQILDFANFLKIKLLVETAEKNPEPEMESQLFLELAQK